MIPLIVAGAALAGTAISAYAASQKKDAGAGPVYDRPGLPAAAPQQLAPQPQATQLEKTQQQGTLMDQAAAIPMPIAPARAATIGQAPPVPPGNPLEQRVTDSLYGGGYGY